MQPLNFQQAYVAENIQAGHQFAQRQGRTGPSDDFSAQANRRFLNRTAGGSQVTPDNGQGIAVRAGLHCAPLAHESAGTLTTGTVRVSFGQDASATQIRAVLQAVSKLPIPEF